MNTSLEAYEAVKPHINALHEKVLGVVRSHNGATASEVTEALGIFHKTVVNRLSELKAAGLVQHTTIKRRNPRGRSETVVVAA